MKLICEKTILADAVAVCIHAVSAKSSIAALEGLLITTGQNSVSLCGYNFKTAIQRSFDATILEAGTAVISARILSDIVRKLPNDSVEITVDEKMMATIRSGATEFNLMATPAREYPDLPDVDAVAGASLPAKVLRDMLGRSSFAVSTNENKPILTGSLFEVSENTLTVVAVDSYRLAMRREPCNNMRGGAFSFVVPGDTLRELSRILPENDEETTIFPDRKHAMFRFERTVVTTRLLEGEFLNYKSVIPDSLPISLKVSTSDIIDSVERVSLIISERLKNPVRCLFDGDALRLSCVTALGRSYDECVIPFCPEPVEIGFNNRYLLDALKACPDDECLLQIKASLSPCILRPLEGDAYLYLVLPVRLKAGE